MYLDAKTPFEAFNLVLGMLQNENNVLKEKANDIVPTVIPVGEWPRLGEFNWDLGGGWNNSRTASFNSYEAEWFKFYGYYGERGVEEITREMLETRYNAIVGRIEELEKANEKCWADNQSAIENNQLIKNKIELIMKHIGVPSYYSTWEYPTSRSRNKKETKHTAGYIGDLNRNVPTAIKGIKPDTASYRKKVDAYYKNALNKLVKAEQEKANREQEEQKVHELALMRAKYCPDNALADVEDIRDNLLSKDKYLRLAYWLERNRGDWTEGSNYAEIGLYSFSPETEEDKEIYLDIEYHINDWQGDGRVFRDCEYNYGVLYSMGDEAMLQDLNKLKEMSDNY